MTDAGAIRNSQVVPRKSCSLDCPNHKHASEAGRRHIVFESYYRASIFKILCLALIEKGRYLGVKLHRSLSRLLDGSERTRCCHSESPRNSDITAFDTDHSRNRQQNKFDGGM